MNFQEFQESKRACDDLGAAMMAPESFVDSEGNEYKAAGFLYADDACYIEQLKDGTFYMNLGNEEFSNADLEAIEKELYEWARGEVFED